MIRCGPLLLLVFLLAGGELLAKDADWAFSPYLVTTEWLRQHLADPDIFILDIRPREEYKDGHLPHARNLPLSPHDPLRDEYRNLFKTANGEIDLARYEEIWGGLGLDHEKTTVVYGHRGEHRTGIVFWLLQLLGYSKVKVFNGGIEAWIEAGEDLERGLPQVTPGHFSARLKKDLYVSSDFVLGLARAYVEQKAYPARIVLLDVRTEKEYSGEVIRPPAVQGGHIPGARLLPLFLFWEGNQDPNRKLPQELKSPAQIKALIREWTGYSIHQLREAKRVVLYCHSGERSAYAFWVLSLLGLNNLANYDDSWIIYGSHPSYPVSRERPGVSRGYQEQRVAQLEERVSAIERRLNRRQISGLALLSLLLGTVALILALVALRKAKGGER